MDATSNLSRCAERRNALQLRMGKGVAIIPTAPERIRNRDSDYLYRFDSYFYYLSAFPEPEAVLVLLAGEQPRSILFCRERNPERELWEGVRKGPEGAKAAFGFEEAYPVKSLDEHMPKLLADQPALGVDDGTDDNGVVAGDRPGGHAEHATRSAGAPRHVVLDVAVDQVDVMPAEPYPRLDRQRRPFPQEVPLIDVGELVLEREVPLMGQMKAVNIAGQLDRDPCRLDAVAIFLILGPPPSESLVEGQIMLADQRRR